MSLSKTLYLSAPYQTAKKQEQIAGRRHARRLLCILTEKRRRTLRIFPKNSGGQLSLVGTLFFC